MVFPPLARPERLIRRQRWQGGLLLEAAEDEGGVVATKAKGVGEGHAHRRLALLMVAVP